MSRCALAVLLVLFLASWAWAETPEGAATALLKALGAPSPTLEPRPSDYDAQRGFVSFAASGVMITVKENSGEFVALSVFGGAPWLPQVSARGVEPTTAQVQEVVVTLSKALNLPVPSADMAWEKTLLPTSYVWYLGKGNQPLSKAVWGLIVDKAGRIVAFSSVTTLEYPDEEGSDKEALAAVKAEVPDLPASAKGQQIGPLWQVGWQYAKGDWWAADVDDSTGKLRYKPVQMPKAPACYATDWRSVKVSKQAVAQPPAAPPPDNLFDTSSEADVDYGALPPAAEKSGAQTGLLITSVLLVIGLGLWFYIRMKRN